jgi:thermitase
MLRPIGGAGSANTTGEVESLREICRQKTALSTAIGHGAATASVIMSDHNPSPDTVWVSGAAPRAKLIPFRVSDGVIHFDFTNVALAIHEAVDQKAHVISMSLGGLFPSRFLERAIERAIANGLIVLAAAGNVWPWVVYPAHYRQVIAVAAVNCRKKPWSLSARGDSVDISAPGESVWRARTLQNSDSYPVYVVEPSSGTSYAVATAAGACALWLAHHGRKQLIDKYGAPRLATVFRELLVTKGFEKPPGWDSEKYGVGILRADRLLEAPLPESPLAAGLVPMALRPARPIKKQSVVSKHFTSAEAGDFSLLENEKLIDSPSLWLNLRIQAYGTIDTTGTGSSSDLLGGLGPRITDGLDTGFSCRGVA